MKLGSRISNCISCAVIASLLSFSVLSHGQNAHTAPPLQKIADVPMPGPAVRFDYQSMDSGSGRLYIAHMNAGQLVIFDTVKQQVVANLDGFKGVHGVWAAPEIDRVFASVTGEHSVAVVDSKTLRIMAKVGPDGLSRWSDIRSEGQAGLRFGRAWQCGCGDRRNQQHAR